MARLSGQARIIALLLILFSTQIGVGVNTPTLNADSILTKLASSGSGINYTAWGRNVTIDKPYWATIDTNESNFPSGYYTPGSKIKIQFQSTNYPHSNETALTFHLIEVKPSERVILEESKLAHTWLYDVEWEFTLPNDNPREYLMNITARSLPGDDYVGSIRSTIIVPGQEIEGSIELAVNPVTRTASYTLRNTGENVWQFNPYGYGLETWNGFRWQSVDRGGVPVPLYVLPPGSFTWEMREQLVGRQRVSMYVTAQGVASAKTLYGEYGEAPPQNPGSHLFSLSFASVLLLASLCFFLKRR